MTSRGGRERFHRDYPSRFEEKSLHGKSNNPPSRHLWVGNLSYDLTERALAKQFSQFGELEKIYFQPGRSYAFIDFRYEEGAFAAKRELQGSIVAGNPLRIEFTKSEKSPTPHRGEEYLQHRNEQHPLVRRSPFSERDSRTRDFSPDPGYSDKLKMNDKNEDPSEVLWIGFPAQLKVDEYNLRKAFSPFGEIDKITAFPGRTYAFVRFKDLMAACRAKETLQGKLFGSPRVNICFARSESGAPSRDRNPMNGPTSPHFRSYGHPGSSGNFQEDEGFCDADIDPRIRSPNFITTNTELKGHDAMGFGLKGNLRTAGDGEFEQRFIRGFQVGQPLKMHEDQVLSSRDRDSSLRGLPYGKFPHEGPYSDDQWDLPEDASLFREPKKPKTSSFPLEKELPEYPFSHPKEATVRMLQDFRKPEVDDKNFDSGPFSYKHGPDQGMSMMQPYEENNDYWNTSNEDFHRGSAPLPSNPEQRRLTPESRQSRLNKEWKWEGTIAKGGNPVCHARCFPVGKALDTNLPEFLDCTAKTSLDMLAKHYYQATNSWVVFFAPLDDPDIAYYNEFMNYLEEKQRAAVAKLDDRTTLFLVPPSEFSEKVLKVPGRLSISGVILRLEPLIPSQGSHYHQNEKDANFISLHGDTSYPKVIPTHPNIGRSATSSVSFSGNVAAASSPLPASFPGSVHPVGNERQHEYVPHQLPHNFQNLNAGAVNTRIHNTVSSVDQGQSLGQKSSNILPPHHSSAPVAAIHPGQLAQLASLLGQQMQSGGAMTSNREFRTSGSENQLLNQLRPSQKSSLPNNESSEVSSSQFAQTQPLQLPQYPSLPGPPQSGALPNQLQQQQIAGDEEADPQKRLKATLELAAALLQQIQQGKGT